MTIPDTPTKQAAQIDRRVRIVAGQGEGTEVRISSLRDRHCYVLLGEPGSGKSTVLEQEAAVDGGVAMTVRDFLFNPPSAPGAFVCLDALDEYRSEGQSSDRLYKVASAMVSAKVGRWRISCRAEDWRLDADLKALRSLSEGTPICVAELLPLNASESQLVLGHWECKSPEQFLDQAERFGALGFVGNPFSLGLLYAATSGGDGWPQSRFTLYSNAIAQLARERDRHRQGSPRSSVEQINHAAGRLNLFLLVTGAQAIWMSNQTPPSVDRGRYIDVEDIGLTHNVVAETLDTALFRGDGESFTPMHRTIAEFSAASYLGEILTGADGSAAVPLARVMAVVGGVDGAPPTELRGLFGWLVTQLADRGRQHEVRELVSLDPVTAMNYGDPALYYPSEKRHLLQQLPSHRPHHGWPEGISLGGLASEALAHDFDEILLCQDPGSDLVQTVVEVLERGRPLVDMHPTYHKLILDGGKPAWLRMRAFDLNLLVHAIDQGKRADYDDDLQKEPASEGRVTLQIHIARRNLSVLTTDKLRTLIHDFETLPATRTIGQLKPFQQALEGNIPVDLFDVPGNTWRPRKADYTRTDAVDHALDELLANIILRGPTFAADRVWRWVQNYRQSKFERYGNHFVLAIKDRYGNDDIWHALLLEAAFQVGSDDPQHALYDYVALTGGADAQVLNAAWVILAANPTKEHLLAGIVYSSVARGWPMEVQRCVEHLGPTSGHKLLEVLLPSQTSVRASYPTAKGTAAAQSALIATPADRAKWLSKLPCESGKFRIGRPRGMMNWAADIYLNGPFNLSCDERLIVATNRQTKDAFVAGFKYLAANFKVSSNALMVFVRRETISAPLLAGIVAALDDGDPTFSPDISLALMVFFTRAREIGYYDQQSRLQIWAVQQFAKNATIASQRLTEYWSLHIAPSTEYLPGLYLVRMDQDAAVVLSESLAAVLRTNFQLTPDQLANALRSIAMTLPTTDLIALVDSVLPHVPDGEGKVIWLLAQMCLNPVMYAEQMLKAYPNLVDVRYLDDTDANGFGTRLLSSEPVATCYFHTFIVCAAGPTFGPPSPPHRNTIGARNYLVRHSIRTLADNPLEAAGQALNGMSTDPTLSHWQAELLSAVQAQAAIRRDDNFAFTQPAKLAGLLRNGPPLNSADLFAVLCAEVGRLQAEMTTDDLSPWTQFWNYNGGTRTTPRYENMCRDYLLGRLRDRLERYHVTASMPEAQHAASTRADMLVISGAKARIPVEVKRHMHDDVWTAAGTQLRHYSDHLDAAGRGVYIVLWFGLAAGKLPNRPDNRPMPTTPRQLQEFLFAELPADLQPTTDIFVLDVSPVVTKHGAKKKGPPSSSAP